ncbi:YHS domain-containing (seleno)protein [Maribacter sp. 2304DJ31-5]|uniref:YHS domain-containing (seleno)protein n=1 Tax=Maribacter sp. 2304DJ31-5 TaxID=3386273 RepID=UPI0039BC7259
MRKIIEILIFMIGLNLSAQSIDYNTKKGYVANGYDVVAYFDGQPLEGSKTFTQEHNGVRFKFSSSKNLEKFKADPKKYIPKYGGYCAYAMAKKGDKVSIDPETYEIRDGRLFLFYNSWGTNTLKSWIAESPKKLRPLADSNWEKVKTK